MKFLRSLYGLLVFLNCFNSMAAFAQQSNDSFMADEGFLNHLYQTGEYNTLFNITERGIQDFNAHGNNTNSFLYLYNSLAATKLERYKYVTRNEHSWTSNDTSSKHFNHLLLANIAAIKLKDDSLSSHFLTQLHPFQSRKEFIEVVFLMDIFDSVVRQRKEPCIASQERIKSLSILTSEDTKDIEKAMNTLLHPKKKSAFVAGGMSALIPGAGKWYAGYFGTPFAALFLNAILGGVAVELAIKQGWGSWPAIISYTAFGTFYAGNIIGSIYSTKIKKKENEAFYKGVLLYHLMSAFERVYRS